MLQESGLETRIIVDTQGIDDATRTLNDSLHSTNKLATVTKLADSSDGKRARVGWNEEGPEGVEPPVILEPRWNGERYNVMVDAWRSRFHFVWRWTPLCNEAFSFFEVALIERDFPDRQFWTLRCHTKVVK